VYILKTILHKEYITHEKTCKLQYKYFSSME